MEKYAVVHVDGIDEFAYGHSYYRPIRHHLGISAFGVNAWTGHLPGDVIINEHSVNYAYIKGRASFEIEGDRVDAPAGTLVFASPRIKRTAVAEEPETIIIAIEGTPGKGYDARGWELWAPLFPRYEAGEYAEVADRLRPLVEASPQYPMLFFNLACCESLLGRTTQALDSLGHAIEMSDEFREAAKTDSDLDPIRGDEAFQQLVGPD